NVTTNAPRAVGWLERLNVAGACADILASFALAQSEETGFNPAAYWKRIYDNGKKLIGGVFLSRMGLGKSYESSDMLVSTSYQDKDGNAKKPFFKKRMWEVPGSAAGVFPDEDISYGE
ncbi:MAG: hypothetical protein KKF27_20765, partial [Gammaproteobacteria bacterium]|nr:hypothetical protein [Gammaproteobacteria bacterium]MBU2685682.1 hypothetical protein [Gammaproteobacteria bacterium]